MNKRANAMGVIIFATIIIFVVGFVWALMNKPMQELNNKIKPEISAENMPTFNKIASSWLKWPIMVIFLVILYAVIRIVYTSGSDQQYRY